jgi:hypothetical protein
VPYLLLSDLVMHVQVLPHDVVHMPIPAVGGLQPFPD